MSTDVVLSEAIVNVDMRVANVLFEFRDTTLVTLFTWITLFAKAETVLSVAAVVALILYLWKKRTMIIPFFVTLLGSGIFCTVGKLIFHRERPSVALYVENTFSYPSGHATMAVALYGFIAYLLLRKKNTWLYRVNIFFGTLAVIAAIGLSRLYLGEHFLSDVLSGYVLGALWLCIGITIAEWLQSKNPVRAHTASTRVKVATWVLVVAEIALFVSIGLTYNPERTHNTTQGTFVAVHCY